MRLEIKLVDGEVLVVDVERDDWSRAFIEAQRRGSLIEIENERGDVLAINPQNVLTSVFVAEDQTASVESLDRRRFRFVDSGAERRTDGSRDRRRGPAG